MRPGAAGDVNGLFRTTIDDYCSEWTYIVCPLCGEWVYTEPPWEIENREPTEEEKELDRFSHIVTSYLICSKCKTKFELYVGLREKDV